MAEMEEKECDDILDDWFIESLKTYKDLHLYQLEHPTQVIEWTSEKTVCVAGYSSSKNEILELRLPLKLFAEEENKGLCAERDFKVLHGGFTDGPVRCLRHIPGTRCVVTNDGLSCDLQVWDLGGDDSGVIRRTGSVPGGRGAPGGVCRAAAWRWAEPRVLHGAQSGDIRLSQLTTGQTVYKLETDSADLLSSLHFLSDAVFLAGCSNGNILVADTRTPAAPQLSPPPSSWLPSSWWQTAVGGGAVLRLSSSGAAVVSDLRQPRAAAGRARLAVTTGHRHDDDSGGGGGNHDDVTASWAPALDGCIAVSGFGGAVSIYNTLPWTTETQEVRPLFEHRGHMISSPAAAVVTAHAWHQKRPRTLLSAAADGSVHLWDWIDQSEDS